MKELKCHELEQVSGGYLVYPTYPAPFLNFLNWGFEQGFKAG